MKSLEQVAKAYKQSAGKAIYPGVPYPKYTKTKSSRAYKTGNLLTSFVRGNKPNEMIRERGQGYVIELDVAPSGAPYGYFVHYGTKNKDNSVRMKARPFADIAWENPDEKLQVAIDKLAEETGLEKIVDPMTENIDTFFQAAGFKSS